MNKLGGRKTHHGFQMHSLGSETLASVFLTTEGLLTVNMFKLWSGSTVLIDTVLIRAFQECLWLGWHRWLFANIANNHGQNHADITAGRLVTGSSACRGWQAAGCMKPYGVVRWLQARLGGEMLPSFPEIQPQQYWAGWMTEKGQ